MNCISYSKIKIIFKILIVIFGISLFIHLLNNFTEPGGSLCPGCGRFYYLKSLDIPFGKNADGGNSTSAEVDIQSNISLEPPSVNFANQTKSEEERLAESIKAIGSIPYLPQIGQTPNGKCGRYPSLYHLHMSNIYWQEQMLHEDVTSYLLNAYVDTRIENKPIIRIIGVIDEPKIDFTLFCQFWYTKDLKTAKTVKIYDVRMTFYWTNENRKKGYFHPYLISCELPDGDITNMPDSVSLVHKECDSASNNLRIRYEVPEKVEDFAVCVKGMDFPYEDISGRLAEWIDLLGILGVSKIFLYNYQVHQNISKVLNYYEETGQVEVIPMTWPGYLPNDPQIRHYILQNHGNGQAIRRRTEVVHYNDCFYRNLHKFRYIAILDTDEMFMPSLKHNNWREMVDALEKVKPNAPSYYFQLYYYFGEKNTTLYGADVPPHFHMLKHLDRSKERAGVPWKIKSLLSTRKVLTVFNHFAPHCLPDPSANCIKASLNVPLEHGQGCHYRANWLIKPFLNVFSEDPVKDENILRFKNQLIERTNRALISAGLYTDPDLENIETNSEEINQETTQEYS